MKNMRHVVNVMRPSAAEGPLGQIQGQPETVCKDWPCSIETMSGREVEQARTVFAEATHKVEGYGNPAKRFRERDYLVMKNIELGTDWPERRLHIGFINDKQQNGVQLSLLCGERTGG